VRKFNIKRIEKELKIPDIKKIEKRLYSKEPTIQDRQRNAVFWLITMPGTGVFLFILGNWFVSLNFSDVDAVTIYVSYIFLAFPLGFILKPPISRIENFFEKNQAAIVIAYQLVTKILYVSGPIMIITLLFFLLPGEGAKSIRDAIQQNYDYMTPVLIALAIASGTISLAIFVKWGILAVQRDFRYVLSQAAIALSLEKEINDRERIKYAIFGINCYNKYLSRHFDLQIKNPVLIFQKIFSDKETIEESLKEIKNNLDEGKLGLLKYFKKYAVTKEDTKYLVKITLRQRLVEASPVIAVIASIVAFVTQIAFTVIGGIEDPTNIIDAIEKLT